MADRWEDIDALIDEAVDTLFVEASEDEQNATDADAAAVEFSGSSSPQAAAPEKSAPEPPPPPPPSGPPKAEEPPAAPDFSLDSDGPSLDEAVDSLFGSPADQAQASSVTSGDDDMDRAIDLAVDTLFVEEPDTPPPETTELDATVVQAAQQELTQTEPVPPPPPAKPKRAEAPPPKAKKPEAKKNSYEDVMAEELDRHLDTLFPDQAGEQTPAPKGEKVPKPPAPEPRKKEAPPPEPVPELPAEPMRGAEVASLRKLQEAILTLEWEISKTSVTALATELKRVRALFQDNVTVEFAAMSMRLVLDYMVKRMSRAHPESVRFLLEVAGLLEQNLTSSKKDPLGTFHQILTRYEHYKSVVRRAENIPDRKPSSSDELGIDDPQRFARVVDGQAATIIKAGRSLANQIPTSEDPEILIRSFRFLVTRSVNRILESTHRDHAETARPKKAAAKGKKADGRGGRS